MTDRPIIFSAPMVQALLAGRKTQTRRLAWRPKREKEHAGTSFDGGVTWERETPWQRVQPGDRLYVRESAFVLGHWRQDGATKAGRPKLRFVASRQRKALYADQPIGPGQQIMGASGNMRVVAGEGYWPRPSIHMPRWASRMTLTVTDVRVQRLFDITEDDARAEGCWTERAILETASRESVLETAVHPSMVFRLLWNDIHGPGAWAANPEVVAISFSAHPCNIDSKEAPT